MPNIQLTNDEAIRLVEFLELTSAGPNIWPEDAKFWVNLAAKIKEQTRPLTEDEKWYVGEEALWQERHDREIDLSRQEAR